MRRYYYTLIETKMWPIEVDAEDREEALREANDKVLSWTLGGDYNELEFNYSEPIA